MLERLQKIEAQFEELAAQMADPEVAGDPDRYREAATAYADLEPVVRAFREQRKALADRASAEEVLASAEDEEMRELAREELRELDERLAGRDEELKRLLLPKDPNDGKNVILEIRAGTGGEEAKLFAGELLRLYQHYCERRGWSFEVLDLQRTEMGGVKEVVAQISGEALI